MIFNWTAWPQDVFLISKPDISFSHIATDGCLSIKLGSDYRKNLAHFCERLVLAGKELEYLCTIGRKSDWLSSIYLEFFKTLRKTGKV